MTARRRGGVAGALAALGLVAGLTVGCSSPSNFGPSTPTASASGSSTGSSTGSASGSGLAGTSTAPASAALAWRGCDGGFQCSTLRVPLDYTHPAAGTVDVAVIRLPATDPKHRIGSLVTNPGGPGGSGVEFLRGSAKFLFPADIRAHFDLVSFDPRGVGASDPVKCLTDAQLDQLVAASARPDLIATAKGLAAACQAKAGRLLSHVGTDDVARDMDRLRAALGDAKLTYLGFSYGTYLGTAYAELFPTHVRALALDGALDPSLSAPQIDQGQALAFERDISDFLGWCVGQGNCPLGTSTSAADARLRGLQAQLQTQPLPVSDGRRAGESLLTGAIVDGQYFPVIGWPELRSALQAALAGNGTPAAQMADSLDDRDSHGHYSNALEANYAVNCIDRPWARDVAAYDQEAAALAKVAPHIGESVGYGGLPCAFWPVPPVSRPAPVHAPGVAPVLVVGTTRDPATPYPWAQALAKQFGNATLLTFVGDGHTAYPRGNSCVLGAVDGYLLDLRLPAAGTVCQ